MVNKKLKEIYCVDTISQDKGWAKIVEALKDITEDIQIDFTGINVIDPWDCPSFKVLLQNPLINMVFTNKLELVNKIKMMCIIDGTEPNRISNVVVELPKEKTAEEKKIERVGGELKTLFELNAAGDTYVFDIRKKYTQMHSTNTLVYFEYAINCLVKESDIRHFILDVKKVSILPNVLEVLADMIVDFETRDIKLEVDLENDEAIKNMGLCLHKATTKIYDEKGRALAIKKGMKLSTPGLLIKYKKSRALDEFGRHGKGEVVSSRISIFRGLKRSDKNNKIVFIVDSFNDKTFFTKQHWIVEHDNEEPTKLAYDRLEIPLEEIGFGDLFLGSSYHFIEPIQQSPQESRYVILDLDENGKNVSKRCTIPERMKAVFDNWGVKYNHEMLDEYIKKTEERLKEVAENKAEQ